MLVFFLRLEFLPLSSTLITFHKCLQLRMVSILAGIDWGKASRTETVDRTSTIKTQSWKTKDGPANFSKRDATMTGNLNFRDVLLQIQKFDDMPSRAVHTRCILICQIVLRLRWFILFKLLSNTLLRRWFCHHLCYGNIPEAFFLPDKVHFLWHGTQPPVCLRCKVLY